MANLYRVFRCWNHSSTCMLCYLWLLWLIFPTSQNIESPRRQASGCACDFVLTRRRPTWADLHGWVAPLHGLSCRLKNEHEQPEQSIYTHCSVSWLQAQCDQMPYVPTANNLCHNGLWANIKIPSFKLIFLFSPEIFILLSCIAWKSSKAKVYLSKTIY